MNVRKYLELMDTAEKLKCNTRHSFTSSGRKESVAEHSWRLVLMAYFMKDEFPDADINKVMLMCLCHDLGEAFTDDIPSFYKTEADETAEDKAVSDFCNSLDKPYNKELSELFSEMSELKTLEARLFKALDKMEAVIQHNEADLSTWIPLEYTENLNYGDENVEFSPYLTQLREAMKEITIEKINKAK